MKRRAWVLAGVGASAALAGAGLAWWRNRADLPRVTADQLWTMSFDAPTGDQVHLGNFRGRPLVVNFWASWCAPCVKEMPQIERFYRQFRSLGWQVVGALEANRRTTQSDLVLKEIHEVHKGILDEETAFRGYLLTSDRSYLESYQAARPLDGSSNPLVTS